MTSLADSSAYQNTDHVLPQHQAALTLLQARLSKPDSEPLNWLDLACGRGQIILGLDHNLSDGARAQINFTAYEINQDYARETRKIAADLGFATLEIKVGDLADFNKLLSDDFLFDFITLTNTVHEVFPQNLSKLLVDSILRLNNRGTLFIYDMEQINPPELGAIPWNRDEVRSMIRTVLDELGATNYKPEVGFWKHRSCNAWNVQLERQYISILKANILSKRTNAIDKCTDTIITLLKNKLELCKKSLEILTLCKANTFGEKKEKERYVYEFWAISRALEGIV